MTNKTKDALAYINDQIEHAENLGEDCEVLYEIREAIEARGLASGFVQNLKRNVEEPIGFDYGDFDIDVIHLLESNGWDNCIDYLQSQGYLTRPVWHDISTAPINQHVIVWIEYKDGSGAGYHREAFVNGVNDLNVYEFNDWDKEHKHITHWMHKQKITPPTQSGVLPKRSKENK